MSRHRTHRKDGNQDAIVKLFRDLGCSVWVIGRPTDLLVGVAGHNLLAEVKRKNGKRTPGQEKFSQEWRGQHFIIRDAKDVPTIVNAMRRA
jgi:hypothetical protein